MSRRRVNAALIVVGAVAVVLSVVVSHGSPLAQPGCCAYQSGLCSNNTCGLPGPYVFISGRTCSDFDMYWCELGACCLPDGACVVFNRGWCELGAGGVFLGLDVPCDGPFCSSGCCLPGLTCEILSQTECLSQGGLWQSDGSDCTTGNCPCPPDINATGDVNVLDLLRVLLCFGLPAVPGCEAEDVNGDGSVNVLDLIDVPLTFGQACP